jgi:hypothetical protein
VVSNLDRAGALDALDAVYRNLTAVTGGLGEADLMLPSRCAGWTIGDVLFHQLPDARRALRGTGRDPLTEQDRHALGPLTARFPLFA